MRLRSIAILLATILASCAPALGQRLPGQVSPRHYDLAFDLDLAHTRFSGVERIDVTLAAAGRRIVLNAVELEFDEATISAGGTTQRATVSLDSATQTAALIVPRDVPAGDASIAIRYHGTLNRNLRGLYLSTANGRHYAVTQFESTDARRAFPSFDEPAFKATFAVRATVDAGDTAISNGTLVSDEPGPGAGRHTIQFATTVKMSSYLVALAVGDFTCIGDTADGIPIRVCAVPGKEPLRQIPLDAAKQILPWLNGFYSTRYPFGKLDLVAVPDFAAGAMENTGAIFYRESELLTDPQTASVGNLKRIWSVIAHEMAHQWFGDLVTMRWWNDLWLNEGFATWMETRPLAALKPEWHIDVDQAADTQQAMALDALASTRPIRNNPETPADIESAFDGIAYEKSAAVLRMVEHYLGSDTFRAGVNAYLEAHAYGNATSEDFWSTMARVSGKPVDRILESFVTRPGVPLLQVSGDCSANATGGLRLQQERFSIGHTGIGTMSGQWQLPVCARTGDGTASCSVVADRSTVQACPRGPLVFLNSGATGYFRTQYPPAMLSALAEHAADSLSAPERLSLLGDEWALVRAQRQSAADYLSLASGFGGEQSATVLAELTGRLTTIHTFIVDAAGRPALERFVRGLLQPLMRTVGFDAEPGEPPERLELRSTLVRALGTTGADPDVSEQARAALSRSLSSSTPLEPTLASAIVSVAPRHGDAALWEQVERAAREAKSPAERSRYLRALAGFEDPALLDRSLALTIGDTIRSQDTTLFVSQMLSNPATNARAWAFVKAHWKELESKLSISGGATNLAASLSGFCDATAKADIRGFFATHPLPAARQALEQTYERIDACVALKAREAPAVARWLSAR